MHHQNSGHLEKLSFSHFGPYFMRLPPLKSRWPVTRPNTRRTVFFAQVTFGVQKWLPTRCSNLHSQKIYYGVALEGKMGMNPMRNVFGNFQAVLMIRGCTKILKFCFQETLPLCRRPKVLGGLSKHFAPGTCILSHTICEL